MRDSTSIQLGDRVIILYPPYAAGLIGVVLEKEHLGDNTPSKRWLIQIEEPSMVLSLSENNVILVK